MHQTLQWELAAPRQLYLGGLLVKGREGEMAGKEWERVRPLQALGRKKEKSAPMSRTWKLHA